MTTSEYLDLLWGLTLRPFTQWSYFIIFSFCILVAAAAYYRSGYKPKWPRTLYKSVTTNFLFWLGNVFFAPLVFVLYGHLKLMFDDLGLPHLDDAVWAAAPFWVVVVIASVAGDFADYWNHRLMHHKWLWPIHAVHHSDAYLNPLTTYRVHFLEPLVMRLSYLPLLAWMGLPKEAVAFGAIVYTLHNMYVHVMVDWGHGPFKYIIASPRMHQWHHADTPEAHGKNLSNVYPFFDVLFGTYYVPGPCNERLGAEGVPENDYVKLCLHPFTQWSKAIAGRVRAVGSSRRDRQSV